MPKVALKQHKFDLKTYSISGVIIKEGVTDKSPNKTTRK